MLVILIWEHYKMKFKELHFAKFFSRYLRICWHLPEAFIRIRSMLLWKCTYEFIIYSRQVSIDNFVRIVVCVCIKFQRKFFFFFIKMPTITGACNHKNSNKETLQILQQTIADFRAFFTKRYYCGFYKV